MKKHKKAQKSTAKNLAKWDFLNYFAINNTYLLTIKTE